MCSIKSIYFQQQLVFCLRHTIEILINLLISIIALSLICDEFYLNIRYFRKNKFLVKSENFDNYSWNSKFEKRILFCLIRISLAFSSLTNENLFFRI